MQLLKGLTRKSTHTTFPPPINSISHSLTNKKITNQRDQTVSPGPLRFSKIATCFRIRLYRGFRHRGASALPISRVPRGSRNSPSPPPDPRAFSPAPPADLPALEGRERAGGGRRRRGMRISELGECDGVRSEGEEEQQVVVEEASVRGGGGGGGVVVARLSAKRALVGAGARVLFYPTLLYNVLRNRFEAEFRWWDRVDQYILLGAVPFPSDVPRLKQLGVQGVVTLNEAYETLVPTSLYQAHGIDHLIIPTRDYLFAPALQDICQAIDFIHRNASEGGITYVHCKAGRGRSTTIVLCYLIKYRSMSPEAALDHVRSIRPRVLLAPSQWQAVNVFSTLTTGRLPIQSKNLGHFLEPGDDCITNTEIDDYYSMELDYEDSGLPLCQVMLPRPTSPTVCTDAVLITEADLEGYDTYADTRKDVVSLEVIVSRKPIMRRLSCLFGSLKLTNNCEPTPSRFAEVRAC
uniref:phosphatidylglycerophosphatase n=1 Tax=Oryza meridionalis TaxID=40149 RepID=A0A0E0DZ18_9ORYZ